MKLVYKPIGIVLGILAGLVGRRAFSAIWAVIDREEPPKPTTRETSMRKAVGAAALKAATFAAVRAAVSRGGAEGWVRLTGTWPGEKRPDPAGSAD